MTGFLDLPLELRLEVYGYLLTLPEPTSKSGRLPLYPPCPKSRGGSRGGSANSSGTSTPCSSSTPSYDLFHLQHHLQHHHHQQQHNDASLRDLHPSILQTCHQIKAEASEVLYSRNIFVAHYALLASLPRLRAWYDPVSDPDATSFIRRFWLRVRLDVAPPWAAVVGNCTCRGGCLGPSHGHGHDAGNATCGRDARRAPGYYAKIREGSDSGYDSDNRDKDATSGGCGGSGSDEVCAGSKLAAAFDGADELVVEAWQTEFHAGPCYRALRPFEAVRGVRRPRVIGSVDRFAGYARWLEAVMACPPGTDVGEYVPGEGEEDITAEGVVEDEW